MIKIAINGATGRMGRRLLALGFQDEALDITSAIASAESPFLGQDAASLIGEQNKGIPITSKISEKPDVVIDFSQPDGAEAILQYCLEQNTGLVMATTGLHPSTVEKVQMEGHQIPIVLAANTSLAVNLTMKLAEMSATALAKQNCVVDVEIIERHHRFKQDAPSGTALRFGELISDAMNLPHSTHGREGMTGERSANEIGYHAVRAGDDPGQHSILFGMLGEKIELQVAASNRDCYAQGALTAAKFLVAQGPGLYSMFDVLGLEGTP